MAAKNLHVVPHNKKWAVKIEGNTSISSEYDTKQEAIDAANDLARSRQVDVLVHGRNDQLLLKSKAKSKIKDDCIRDAFRDGSLQSIRGSLSAKKKSSSTRSILAKKRASTKGPTRGGK